MTYRSLGLVLLCALLFQTAAKEGMANKPDHWLRGSGKDLEIRLAGEIVVPDGHAPDHVRVVGHLDLDVMRPDLELKVEGNRFETWVPFNRTGVFAVWFEATTEDGSLISYVALRSHEIRQAAIDGVTLVLQQPTRFVAVKVLDKGKPVAGAMVKAEIGSKVASRVRTDADGVARFKLLQQHQIARMTAWTDDFRIGGFSFNRQPTRDPDANEFVIELSDCQPKTIRLVDENNSPVPGIEFVLQIATGEPNHNFLGTTEHSHLTTNADGEVVFPWFPKWDDYFLYIELKTDQWLSDDEGQAVGDILAFKLKKSRIAERKRVEGQVTSSGTSAAGFLVTVDSFQGELESRSDVLSTLTNHDGTYAVDVLPNATYHAYVVDARWPSDIIELISNQSASGQVTPPVLTVTPGEQVTITVTSGPKKLPYPHLPIYISRQRSISWSEDGIPYRGGVGPGWYATTDESGRAVAYTLPGQLKASVYTPLWGTKAAVDVSSGSAAKIELHREVDEKRKVRGQVVAFDASPASLEDVEIRLCAVDGKYSTNEQSIKPDRDGKFSFEIMAATIGIFGYAKDGTSAGMVLTSDLSSVIKLQLQPTAEYQGRLLIDGDQPLANHLVAAQAVMGGERDLHATFANSLKAKRIETKTDRLGNFNLVGLPTGMKVQLDCDPIGKGTQRESLGEIYPEPNEVRPRVISRLGKTSKSAGTVSLEERYTKVMRDCALLGFHCMVILHGKDESGFVTQNLNDYETNRAVASYMQIVIAGDQSVSEADLKFMEQQNWLVPTKGYVFACALDQQGEELGRISLDIDSDNSGRQAAEFVHNFAPRPVDALKKWQEAFDEAKRSKRKVWARLSGRYCGPCFLLARWLDDHRELLEKDYVMLKIDGFADHNADTIAERLHKGKLHGIPFHAVFDDGETMLIDSASPLGNIGHPSSFDGKKHLRKMLMATRSRLSENEIDQLVSSLPD